MPLWQTRVKQDDGLPIQAAPALVVRSRKSVAAWWAQAALPRMLAPLALVCILLTACAGPADRLEAANNRSSADAVAKWTLLADYYGRGGANWRTLAIMHRAMHDALNAAQPVYARWAPPSADEPPSGGASPEVAMTAAARQVLLMIYPDRQFLTERNFQAAMDQAPDGPAKDAGIRLGTAIGTAAVRQRMNDGLERSHDFAGAELPGRWRPVPRAYATSPTSDTVPFLFTATSDVQPVPPPALGSPRYLQDLTEVARVGSSRGAQRTGAETESAFFWARQSSQRGFVHLALQLMAEHPPAGGMHEQARIMSQLASALADSAILVWTEKERFSVWRPVTAINAARAGTTDDGPWTPLIETPPFPEYPSGHAADCFIGAGVLRAAFPGLREPIVYVALNTVSDSSGGSFGMGQHAQADPFEDPERRFPSLEAAAEDCGQSRIWAGAHFRAGLDEARRVAGIVVTRATAAVPAVAAGRKPTS